MEQISLLSAIEDFFVDCDETMASADPVDPTMFLSIYDATASRSDMPRTRSFHESPYEPRNRSLDKFSRELFSTQHDQGLPTKTNTEQPSGDLNSTNLDTGSPGRPWRSQHADTTCYACDSFYTNINYWNENGLETIEPYHTSMARNDESRTFCHRCFWPEMHPNGSVLCGTESFPQQDHLYYFHGRISTPVENVIPKMLAATGSKVADGQLPIANGATITAITMADSTSLTPKTGFDTLVAHMAAPNTRTRPTPILDDALEFDPPTSKSYDIPYKIETKQVYVCTYEECNKKYGRLPELRRHQRGTHLNDLRYKCRITSCNRAVRGFPRRDKRDDHEKKVHQRREM